MIFSIAVYSSPQDAQASYSAYRFAEAALAQGHKIHRIFFYHQGVQNASAFGVSPQDEINLTAQWHALAKENQFELALASHFLLLYSKQLSYDFHISSIDEVMRVAMEFRIFPVLTLDGKKSPYLDNLIDHYKAKGLSAELKNVDYEFQIGGNEMLVITH